MPEKPSAAKRQRSDEDGAHRATQGGGATSGASNFATAGGGAGHKRKAPTQPVVILQRTFVD